MSIIEQATKRLEALNRAGVSVPWGAAGLGQSDVQARVESVRQPSVADPALATVTRLPERHPVAPDNGASRPQSAPRNLAPLTHVTLDLERLERAGHVVPTHGRSSLAEEFRHIKRPLVKNARSKDSGADRLSLIMVTSALPGEGKTFCAINLAMSMAAEIDMSVLLVDADVVRPEVLNRLGIHAEKGLLDLLVDPRLKAADVVLQTNVPKLSILPAGKRSNYSTELLASDAMESLLSSLATDYPDCVVILDAPPLLVTNEAKVLASRVGQVVLVVGASTTQRSAVAQAFAAVEQCPTVMSVLNRAHEPTGPGGYGYYYG